MNPISTTAALLTALSLLSPSSHAAVKMPVVIADHMVILRDKPVNTLGTANPGEKTSVSFAENDGKWSVKLPAQKASATGRPIIIKDWSKHWGLGHPQSTRFNSLQ